MDREEHDTYLEVILGNPLSTERILQIKTRRNICVLYKYWFACERERQGAYSVFSFTFNEAIMATLRWKTNML